jgi:hypothetical protein
MSGLTGPIDDSASWATNLEDAAAVRELGHPAAGT